VVKSGAKERCLTVKSDVIRDDEYKKAAIAKIFKLEPPTKTTKGQSNLAKAASNAPHTLHALDSMTVAVSKICGGSQKLKVGHVTKTRICI